MSGESGTESGHGRGRRRRRSRRNRNRSSSGNRPSQGRGAKGGGGNQSKRGHGRKPRKEANNGAYPSASNTPCLGAERYFTGELNEFELFCAYHLGIQPDGCFKKPSLNDVARRFRVDGDAVKEALRTYRMDPERVREAGFDTEMAKLDVEVVPPGIDRVELARTIFKDFLEIGCGIGPVPERRSGSDPSAASDSGSD